MQKSRQLSSNVSLEDLKINDLVDVYFYGQIIKSNCLIIKISVNIEDQSINEISLIHENKLISIGNNLGDELLFSFLKEEGLTFKKVCKF